MGPSVRHHFSRIVRSALLKIIFASFLLPVLFSSLSAQTPSRTINIKVAFDEEFYLNSKWKLTLRRVISASSRKFEKHFGIKLKVIDYENWKSDDSLTRVYDLINDLRKKVLLKDCDIVVGFSGQWTRRDDISGAAIYLRNYAVVKGMSSEQVMSLVLIHELCHLFGAIDLNEKGSIMDMKNVGRDFDAFTTRIVLLNRNRNFIPHIFPLKRDKWDKVITLYKERKRLERKEVDLNVMLATFHIEKKEYDSAIAECLEFLESFPNSAEIHNFLGIAFRWKGELERALEEYKMVLSLQSGIPEIHFNMGIVLTKLGRLEEAIIEYKRAIDLKPDYSKAYSNLGSAYLKKGKVEEAVDACQKAVELKPDYAFAYSNLGYAFLVKGLYEEAKSSAARAAELDPGLPEAYNLLGFLHEREEQFGEAYAEYLKALELDPENIKTHLNLANLYFKKTLLERSAYHYKKVLDLNPQFASAYNNLAIIFFYQKDYPQAWAHLKTAERLGAQVHPEFKEGLKKKLIR